MDTTINLLHILGVAPLLYYVSQNPNKAQYLKYLAVGVAGYHAYRYYTFKYGQKT